MHEVICSGINIRNRKVSMHLTDLNGMDTPPGRRDFPSSAILHCNSSPPLSWLQRPPAQMPWGVSQPPLVRFTAELGGTSGGDYMPNGCVSQVPCNFTQTTPMFSQTSITPIPPVYPAMSPSVSSACSLKRKLSAADDAEMLRAVNKLHISEERMVSHQQGVHALSQLASAAIKNVAKIPEGKRIVLSKEVQQFPVQEPILPAPLLDRIRRPSNALVLWQPPRLLTTQTTCSSSSDEEDVVDNNNSSTLDLNNMPSFSETVRPAPTPAALSQEEEDIDMEAL